jgi:hypothetical protein
MIKKIIFIACIIIMLFLTIAAAVQSYPLNDWMPINAAYYYYHEGNSMPSVYGPFPQYYFAHNDFNTNFHPDDLNHFDEFIGYQDLDVIYPAEGRIDVLRNPYAQELDLSDLPEGVQPFGEHVSGVLPGGAVYTKHYMHEHPWSDDHYGGYYGYFTPFSYYTVKPSCTRSCQSMSACQYRYGC